MGSESKIAQLALLIAALFAVAGAWPSRACCCLVGSNILAKRAVLPSGAYVYTRMMHPTERGCVKFDLCLKTVEARSECLVTLHRRQRFFKDGIDVFR